MRARRCAAGETRYTDSRGLPELREAIARRQARAAPACAVDPERVLVTSGTSPAMLLVFSLLVEPGDEVVIGDAALPLLPELRALLRRHAGVRALRSRATAIRSTRTRCARALSPRTRAIVVGSPANPTGAVQTARDAARELAALGLPLVSDEIYDGLVYDGARATSALEVGERRLRARRLLEALRDDRLPARLR